MLCPSCTITNRPNARFCTGCGAALVVNAPVIVAPPVSAVEYIAPDEAAPLIAPTQPYGPIIVSNAAANNGGIVGKTKGFWNGSYNRSQAFLDRMIPPPVATRNANPYLAAALELLGYVGVLGAGRIYAGDVGGGIRTMLLWLAFIFGISTVISIGGIFAAIAAIPTLGLSIVALAVVITPMLFPLLVVPFASSVQLFAQLKRWQSRP